MLRFMFVCVLVLALHADAGTLVLLEDFERATVGYSVSVPEVSDGAYDYFGRFGSPGGLTIHSGVVFSNAQGVGFFGAMDLDGLPGAPGAQASITWTNLDIGGLHNLTFSALFAEDDAADGFEDWDKSDDFLLVEYRLDGGAWQSLLRFENNGSIHNSAAFQDTDFDGLGDGAELTGTFVGFTNALSGTGLLLDLRITIDLNSEDEDVAFDNVRITGEGSGVGVHNISNLLAQGAGTGQISLGWQLNANNHPVVVARSASPAFGVPMSGQTFSPGDSVPGGGAVVYTGSGTAFFDSGLVPDEKYFYTVWSVDDAANYSPGARAAALASPYAEGLTVIHVNDVHSRLTPHDYDIPGTNDIPVLEKVGGAAYMATRMLELKAANPGSLIVDAGDVSEGSILGDLRSNGGLLDFYKELDRKLEALGGRGIDASVVGNHDVRYAEMLVNMRACTNFPFLSMNIIELATGEPYFEPFITVVADGKKVGVLGYTTDTSSHLGPETATLIRVAKCGWDDPAAEIRIKDYVDQLRNEEHCDVVVMLVHVGHSRVATDYPPGGNYQLIKDDGSTEPPEVVIGGHWHTMTWTVWQPSILNHKTIIAEAASYLQFIGEIELTDDGAYIDSQKHAIRNADIVPDPDILAVVDNLLAEYNASSNKLYDLDHVIGHSAVDLRMNKNKWWSHNEFPWAGDNTAGAWIADAMQWYVESQTAQTCHLALQSGGGVRRDNAAGPITYLEIYETYPWQDDNMVLIDATGSDIWNFIQDDYVGTSISKDWKIFAHDGVITNITFNGADIGLDTVYQVVVSDYMYSHDNEFVSGGWSDASPIRLTHSIRQSVIDYTAQFGEANPMQVSGPRYILNTGHAGRFQAVVTMTDDVDDYSNGRQPYHESVFVRLLSATPDTVARRGGYVDAELVNADGSINPEHRFSESMLYRSYLGFEEGALVPGTVLNIQVEAGFYGGNPQWTEQTGIVADGVEFDLVGTNLSLAAPDYKGCIDDFWDEGHEGHYVVFEGEKIGSSLIRDRRGRLITVYGTGAYDSFSLPGQLGDHLELEGVQTYALDERRFRCAKATVVDADYVPYSFVHAIVPKEVSGAALVLSAFVSDATEDAIIEILPSDDAYVADGQPNLSSGTNTTLYLQSASTVSNAFGDERIFMKFDLSSLPAGAAVESAKLHLNCYGAYFSTANLMADLYACTNDAWQEETLTWNTQPAQGPLLASTMLFQSLDDAWYAWDCSGFIAEEMTGDGRAGMMLKARNEEAGLPNEYAFNASEYMLGIYGPFLELEISGGPSSGGIVTNVTFHYRHASDGSAWGAWTPIASDAVEPWNINFQFPEGDGWYEFYSIATDDARNVEPAPIAADARVRYMADLDGDGMIDAWERAYFGSPEHADGTTDWDGDGFIDQHEYRAGTNPTNANDLLLVTLFPQTNEVVVSWLSAEGRFYSVQRSEHLLDGFTNIVSGIEAIPPENTITDRIDSVEARFYRVLLDD